MSQEQQVYDLTLQKYEQDLKIQTKSGVHLDFNDDHRDLNRQVFTELLEYVPFSNHDIHFQSHCDLIYRFLIARHWNVDVTVKNMKEYFAWRRKDKIDAVLWERFDDDLAVFGPIYRGFSKEGYPVTWNKLDFGQISALLAKYPTETLLRRNWVDIERARRMLAAYNADRIFAVWDLSALSFAAAMNASAISHLKLVAHATQMYYPELLHTMFLCNGGRVLSAILAVVKPFLDARVQKKVQDVGTGPEKMATTISNIMSLDEVSPLYGGKGPEQVDMDDVLDECVRRLVPEGTPPLRKKTTGVRSEVKLQSSSSDDHQQQQQNEISNNDTNNNNNKNHQLVVNTDDHDDKGDGNNSKMAMMRRTSTSGAASLVSCESGSIDDADVTIMKYERSTSQTSSIMDAADAQDKRENTNRNNESSSTQPSSSLLTASAINQNNQLLLLSQPSPTSTTTASSVPAVGLVRTVPSFAAKIPPKCVHLFITLRMIQFPELLTYSRTELAKNNKVKGTALPMMTNRSPASPAVAMSSPSPSPARSLNNSKNYIQVASALPLDEENFTTIGLKVMGNKTHTQIAEVVGEAGHVLRSHLLVLDEKRRVHFILQKGAVRNEIRVFKPESSLLETVEQKKNMHFQGPADRVLFARILPLSNGSWFALREAGSSSSPKSTSNSGNDTQSTKSDFTNASSDEESSIKRTAINAVLSHAPCDSVLARCLEFPSSELQTSASYRDLFQLPSDYKAPRGNFESKPGHSVAFHRAASFEHDFLRSPVCVLTAFVAAVDACFLKSSSSDSSSKKSK